MKLKEPFLSVHRRMCLYFREWNVRTYAIEVTSDYVDDFDAPGTEICDKWEGENGSTIFVVRSSAELRDLSQIVKGIIGVTCM
jgi:hypothetical protein